MQTTKWTKSGIMRRLATPRSRMTAMLVGAVLIAFSLALLALPAPAVSRVADQEYSLASERKAEHQWLAERNAAYTQRWMELRESWMEPAPLKSAAVVAPQVVDPAVQSVADYLRVHANVDSSVNAQAVPDGAVQSVSDYLAVHARVDMPVGQPQFYAPCCDPLDR